MIFMIVYLFCVIAAVGLGVLAGWSDFRGMTIPNYIVVFVLAAFFIACGAAHLGGAEGVLPARTHLVGGILMLAATFVMYALKAIGGGDSKLAAAFSFWFGTQGLVVFLSYMVFAGGLLALAALYLKKKQPVASPAEGSWIARVQGGESVVPYGIPIALGAFAAFIKLGYFAPETLKLFLE